MVRLEPKRIPRRIVLLGRAGAGKTTLARRIGAAAGVPVICLDSLWPPDRGAMDVAQFRAMVEAAHAGDAWVSDGNFAQASFDLRLPRADLVVWMEPSRLACSWRAITRVLRPGEAHRPRGLAAALRFIWRFDRVNRPRIEALLAVHGPDVPAISLCSPSEVDMFVARITGSAD